MYVLLVYPSLVHLSAQQELGLRCLLRVAERVGEAPASVAWISETEGISPEYTARLMAPLRRAGLVTATRGPRGGYRMAHGPDSISVWTALDALGDSFFAESFCDRFSGQGPRCSRSTDCSIRALWQLARSGLRELFSSISLADLQVPEEQMAIRLQSAQPATTEKWRV